MLSPSQNQDQNLHLHKPQGGPVNMSIKQYCSGTTGHTYHTCQGQSLAVSPEPMLNNGRVKQGIQRRELEHDDDNDQEERSQ